MHISICGSVNGTDELWSANAGGWISEATPAHIDAILHSKMNALRPARNKFDELWLVIVNDWASLAAGVDLSADVHRWPYQHSFDRLLWLDPHAPAVVRLHCERDISH